MQNEPKFKFEHSVNLFLLRAAIWWRILHQNLSKKGWVSIQKAEVMLFSAESASMFMCIIGNYARVIKQIL